MKLLNRFTHNNYTVDIKQANNCMYYSIFEDGDCVAASNAYHGIDNYDSCLQESKDKCDDLDGINLLDLDAGFKYA